MRHWLNWVAVLLVTSAAGRGSDAIPTVSTNDQRTVLLVVGLPGEDEYATEFNAWAENWRKAAELAQAKWIAVGLPAVGTAEQTGSSTPASEAVSMGLTAIN